LLGSRDRGIAAIVAVFLTARQLHEPAELQQEQRAITMFSEYAKQAYEVDKEGDAFPMFVQHTAESIYRLRSDSGWRATVGGLLADNKRALLSVKDWHCDAWDAGFFDYAVTTPPGLCCVHVPAGHPARTCKD
jgi:hypothetical protein